MNESDVLSILARRFRLTASGRRLGVRVGVGDDCALVDAGRGARLAVTTDAMVEGVDFDLKYFSWSDVGYKAISASVSDIYACGASPWIFLVTAGIPKGTSRREIDDLISGLFAASRKNNGLIVGGDLSASPKLFVDVCSIGRQTTPFKSRRGARPGDFLFVSGPLGSSRAGWMFFRKNMKPAAEIRGAHLRPEAPRAAGLALARQNRVTSMMDVSDGLLTDLSRLCAASGVSAGIYPRRIPVSSAARSAFARLKKNPVTESMIGGEDYVLLFAVRPPVPAEIHERFHCIGRILGRSRRPVVYDLERDPAAKLDPRGFVHQF